MAKNISFTIKFWRQNGPREKGHFDSHVMKDIPDDTSFLEMLDILNEELINEGKEPFVFDHDCREGICGMCSLYINGTPHGKTERGATTCQLYMPLTRLSRQVARPVYALVRLRMPTPSSSRSRMPTRLWTVLPASAVVLVWLHVRMVLPCCSFHLR